MVVTRLSPVAYSSRESPSPAHIIQAIPLAVEVVVPLAVTLQESEALFPSGTYCYDAMNNLASAQVCGSPLTIKTVSVGSCYSNHSIIMRESSKQMPTWGR